MAKFQKAEVFEAASTVEYAEGGVVSKEIVHSKAGSITLFSFDEGQGLSEHIAPYDALVQVLDGEMLLTVSGIEHAIRAGESFVIPSGAAHAVHAAQKFKMMLTMIRG